MPDRRGSRAFRTDGSELSGREADLAEHLSEPATGRAADSGTRCIEHDSEDVRAALARDAETVRKPQPAAPVLPGERQGLVEADGEPIDVSETPPRAAKVPSLHNNGLASLRREAKEPCRRRDQVRAEDDVAVELDALFFPPRQPREHSRRCDGKVLSLKTFLFPRRRPEAGDQIAEPTGARRAVEMGQCAELVFTDAEQTRELGATFIHHRAQLLARCSRFEEEGDVVNERVTRRDG